MKLIISSSELLKGVMAVAKAIPAKSALPILENFLFDLKGNMLEITASDSELTLKTQVGEKHCRGRKNRSACKAHDGPPQGTS